MIRNPNLPGMAPAAPQAPGIIQRQAPVAAPQPQKDWGHGGLFDRIKEIPGMFGDAIAGPRDMSLSVEENRRARNAALRRAGMTILAASGPQAVAPNLGQLFAQGMAAGQQAYQGTAQEIGQQRATQAKQQLLQGIIGPNGQINPGKARQLMVSLIGQGDHESAKMIADQLKGADPMILSAGASAFNPDGTLIASNPKGAGDPFDGLPGELKAALFSMGVQGMDQLTPQQRQEAFKLAEQYRRAGGMNVSLGPQQERTSNGVVDYTIGRFEQANDAARAANSRLTNLSAMRSLLNQGLQTGGLQALTQPLRQLGASLGYDTENMSQEALFGALSARMALDSKEGMTGPMSDKDIAFLQAMVPQLKNTPEGNRLMIEVMTRMAQRDIALAAEANRWVTEKGTLDQRWLQREAEFLKNYDLFSDLRGTPEFPIDGGTPPWER